MTAALSALSVSDSLPEQVARKNAVHHLRVGTDRLAKVLAHRARELAPPMQMCDALAANIAPEFATVVGNCLAHGRRGVVEILENFPESARHVIEALAKVYEHDGQCRREKMSSEQRLKFHQEHSRPVLDDLQRWMAEQFELRLVEPNSGLGKALNYLLKRWDELTLFLRRAGAPLDNNLCEQALKRAILRRLRVDVLQDGQGSGGRRHLHEHHPHLPAVRRQPVRVSASPAAARPGGHRQRRRLAALELPRAAHPRPVSSGGAFMPPTMAATPARCASATGPRP